MTDEDLRGAGWKERFPPLVIASGLVLGGIAGVLVKLGNPGNMGLCIACFERDIAGALGLHRAVAVQYLRPEIFAIVLGAAAAARLGGEFIPRSGSAVAVRFLLGTFVTIGALVFLGCPTRMVLRLGGGDGNALVGLAGFAAGIAAGALFLRRGTSLGTSRPEAHSPAAWILPLLAIAGAVLLFTEPSFVLLSEKGPGSKYAPVWASLAGGAIIGALGQRSRLCFAGGLRDLILFRSPHLLSGFLAVFIGVFAMNLALGAFHPGFAGQPVAHQKHLWNFLPMVLVGLGSVLLGGCPFRQLILASQGDGGSFAAVVGMVAGGAVAHNFKLAASPNGVTSGGMVAVAIGLAVCLVVGLVARKT